VKKIFSFINAQGKTYCEVCAGYARKVTGSFKISK